jgi:hypothetical protein
MSDMKPVTMEVRYEDGAVDKFKFNRNDDEVNLMGRSQHAATRHARSIVG